MGRFDSLLSQVSDGGRFSSVLDKVDSFGWEDVSPILQRKRKPTGGYEYRPNPARGQGAPGVGVQGEDPREKAIRDAMARTPDKPQSVPAQIVEQLKPRVAAGAVSLPEMASGLQGIAEKVNPGMRPARPLPPGLSPAELLNPRTLYPKPAKDVVDRVYSEREEAAQVLARKMTEAGFSPEASALADTGLELVAQTVGDPTNVLPGVGLVGAARRVPAGLAPDTLLSREASLAAQLPEAPLPATRTRGAETLARALGEDAIDGSEASGRFTMADARRQRTSFPPDFDVWLEKRGIDQADLAYPQKVDFYGEMVAEEKAAAALDRRPDIVPDMQAKVFRVADREFTTAWQAEMYRDALDPVTGRERPPLTRERWEEIRAMRPEGATAGAPAWRGSLAPRPTAWSGGDPARAVTDLPAFLARREGQILDAAELPFELRDLPLTRWVEPGREIGMDPVRGGQFWEVGDANSTAYLGEYRRRAAGSSSSEGGTVPIQEVYTPKRPLVIAGKRAFAEKNAPPPSAPQSKAAASVEQALEQASSRGQSVVRVVGGEWIVAHPAGGVERFGGGMGAQMRASARRAELHPAASLDEIHGDEFRRIDRFVTDFARSRGHDSIINVTPLGVEVIKLDAADAGARVPHSSRVSAALAGGEVPSGRVGIQAIFDQPEAAGRLGGDLPLVRAGLAKPSEVGALRIGSDPVRADPATEAFRASVFQEQPATPSFSDRMRDLKNQVIKEFDSEQHAYLSRMAKAGAREQGDLFAFELRRAGHTALMPIHTGTRKWAPDVGKYGEWEITGAPLEEVAATMDDATRRQAEAVLAAQSQVEFAGRFETARTEYGMAKAQNRAERIALRDEGKQARAGIRGIEAEARVLRAKELQAARAAGRATGKAQTLSPLVSRATATGKRADEALRDLVHAARDSEEAAEAAAKFLVRERAWRDVAEQGWREGEKRWREAGAAGLKDPGAARGKAARGVERAAYESGVSDAALDAAYEAVTAGRRARRVAGRELTAAERRLAAAQSERARLEGVRGQAAEASRKKLDEVIRANRAEARAAVAREKERAKISRLERPADLDLEIDKARTAESAQYLADMAPDLPRLQPHLAALRDYMDRAFLQPLERLGVFSPAEAAEIRAKNQHYAYLLRAEEFLGADLRSGEAVMTRTSPVRRRTAGLVEDGKIVPPIEAIALQATRIDRFQVRQAARNDLAMRALNSPDLWPELLPAKVGEPGTFVFWKDGKQGAIKAPGELLDVVDNLGSDARGLAWKVARSAKSMMTSLATTFAPGFSPVNFLKDQASAAVFTQSERLFGYLPLISPGKVLFENVYSHLTGKGGSKAWKDFQSSAAGHSTFLRADREGMQRALQEARERVTPGGNTRRMIREAANPAFVPATISNTLESATRVAEREILLREGKGAREAARGAATVTIDFSAGGKTNKKINEVVGFHNVKFLDNSRFLKEFFGPTSAKRKMTIASRAFIWVTLPALAEEWLHRDDKDYQNIPLWDQALFFHLGGDTVEGSGAGGLPTAGEFADGWYKRIPRPQGILNLVFGILPQLALRAALRDDPHAADMAMRGMLDGTPLGILVAQSEQGGLEPSMGAVPTIARGPAELIANRKWTGAPVVPDPRLPVEQQFNDRTSPFVRELAGALPDAAPDFLQSPQQLEHLIAAQTAGTGRVVLDALNPATRSMTGEAEPPKEPFSPRDVPVLRNFMSPPPEGFDSLPVEDLRNFADRVDGLADLLRKVEASDPGRARILRATYPEISAGKGASEATKQLSVWRKERESIKAAKIPDELKRARLRRLDKEVTRYAEDWMKEWRKSYPDLLQ